LSRCDVHDCFARGKRSVRTLPRGYIGKSVPRVVERQSHEAQRLAEILELFGSRWAVVFLSVHGSHPLFVILMMYPFVAISVAEHAVNDAINAQSRMIANFCSPVIS